MTVRELINILRQYEIDDHNLEADICFYDVENERFLELNDQSDNMYPGVELGHYPGCGCIWDVQLNFKTEDDNITNE